MTSARPQSYVARSALDLVALAPTVLGFHPEDSVVLMTFGPPGGSFHARVDLPVAVADQQEVAGLLVEAMVRNRLDRAAVLLYSSDAGLAQAQGHLLLDRLLDVGVEVIDVIRVHEGRFYAVLEDDDVGAAYDLTTHPFTAERVLGGQVVHRDRSALADTLVGADPADVAEVTASAQRHAQRLAARPDDPALLRREARWLQRRVRGVRPDDARLDAEDAGHALVLAAIVATRDVAWAEITRDTAVGHVELWRDVLRRAPRDLVPGAAALLAFAAWQHGDGALAWCAIDRCLEVDPDYSMALGLADLIGAAVPPGEWLPITEDDLPVFADLADPSSRAP